MPAKEGAENVDNIQVYCKLSLIGLRPRLHLKASTIERPRRNSSWQSDRSRAHSLQVHSTGVQQAYRSERRLRICSPSFLFQEHQSCFFSAEGEDTEAETLRDSLSPSTDRAITNARPGTLSGPGAVLRESSRRRTARSSSPSATSLHIRRTALILSGIQ